VNQRPAARAYVAAVSGTKDYKSGYQEYEQDSMADFGNLYEREYQCEYEEPPQVPDDGLTVKAFALLSIAEKALQEASGMNTSLKCWGCGKAGHAFGKCPQEQNKAIQECYLQKLEEWKERGGNVTRMLLVNYVKYNWKDLGFQTQQQAELLCDIMSFHTSVEARRACLCKLDKHNNDSNSPKGLLMRRTGRPKCDQDETETILCG
jgi:hypothetical protein